MKQITLEPIRTDDEADKLSGTFLTDDECKVVVDDYTKVLNEDGDVLGIYVPNAISLPHIKKAYDPLYKASQAIGSNRGIAQGRGRIVTPDNKMIAKLSDDGTRAFPLKKDGTFKKRWYIFQYQLRAPQWANLRVNQMPQGIHRIAPIRWHVQAHNGRA